MKLFVFPALGPRSLLRANLARHPVRKWYSAVLAGIAIFFGVTALAAPARWQDDLTPIADSDWSRARAAHLLERAGFGSTPDEIDRFARLTPRQAVRQLVRYQQIANPMPAFDDSGAFDPGLEPFSPSRPAATEQARDTGEALGVKVKPEGNRRIQQVADRYLYWLRATKLESQRVAYWWANRMLTTRRPLEEKMQLCRQRCGHGIAVEALEKRIGVGLLEHELGVPHFRQTPRERRFAHADRALDHHETMRDGIRHVY